MNRPQQEHETGEDDADQGRDGQHETALEMIEFRDRFMTELALKRKQYDMSTMLPFVLMHAAALLVLTVPFTPSLFLWLFGSYFLRMFAVTGGYHRYFSHRSYKLNRFWQFAMAFLAETSAQKGVLWWAAHHRDHHLHSIAGRPALARARGFW
jgi:stearoyl-CoA desaturase (delta-9 desaturase)